MTSTSSLPFKSLSKEADVAVLSVLRACHLSVLPFSFAVQAQLRSCRTRKVQESLVNEDTLIKKDKSPVTGLSTLRLQGWESRLF